MTANRIFFYLSGRKGESPALEYSDLVGTMKGAMQEMMEGMITSKEQRTDSVYISQKTLTIGSDLSAFI
jgi:hypothetical protein